MESIIVLVSNEYDGNLDEIKIKPNDYDFIDNWGIGYFSSFVENAFSDEIKDLNLAINELISYAPNSINFNGVNITIKDTVMVEVAHDVKNKLLMALNESDDEFARKSWQYNKIIFDYKGTYICYIGKNGNKEVSPINQWLMDDVRKEFIKTEINLKIIQVAYWK